jgi:exopolyphosphatase / guanosine-5'-triphosphate,3'-diphosphate pyrophosphatase
MMRFAAIDIGTNTVLLLIADVDERGIIHPVEHQQRSPRLGRDVDKHKQIKFSAFDKIARILNEYKQIAHQLDTDYIVACGTSAVRDASNRKKFVAYLKQTTGINVKVISGKEEAMLTYRGAISGFPELENNAVVLDIGGGSTEISFFTPSNTHQTRAMLKRFSFQLGSVRLTERYFHYNPPEQKEIDEATNFIRSEVSTLEHSTFTGYSLIAVAGTATTLACLDQCLMDFDVSKVGGYKLTRLQIGAWSQKLFTLTSEEIRSLSNTTEGRADILAAGVLILYEFMRQLEIKCVLVSERGLRYGLVLREWGKSMQNVKVNSQR